MRRLFIAVEINLGVAQRLAAFQGEIQSAIEEHASGDLQLRAVAPENLHLTLKFLGDTEPSLVPLVVDELAEFCEPLFPFEVECRGVGAFPNLEDPRVLWVGLDEQGAEVLRLLQRALEEGLERLGVPRERRDYRPHITLGRLKGRRAVDLHEVVEPFRELSFGKSFLREVVLFESHLDHRGPRYEVVERLELGQPSSSGPSI